MLKRLFSDINECDDPSACQDNAYCTNTPDGSFTCTCQDGYIADGSQCIGNYQSFLSSLLLPLQNALLHSKNAIKPYLVTGSISKKN